MGVDFVTCSLTRIWKTRLSKKLQFRQLTRLVIRFSHARRYVLYQVALWPFLRLKSKSQLLNCLKEHECCLLLDLNCSHLIQMSVRLKMQKVLQQAIPVRPYFSEQTILPTWDVMMYNSILKEKFYDNIICHESELNRDENNTCSDFFAVFSSVSDSICWSFA